MEADVRKDLLSAQQAAWNDLARPGSWWTADERLELASIARLAIADPEPLPPWVGVSSTDRLDPAAVPAVAADAAYRIARHAGTMTETVYRSVADEIGELRYVELCSVVSAVAAVVSFHRAAGTVPPPFPEPTAGEPTGERPDDVVAAELNWVPVAAPADQTAAVVQAYSAVPGAMRTTWTLARAQYIPEDEMGQPDWMRRPDGLTRPEAELVAARVAQLRECFY
ncbi:MAG: hypothetical protein AAFP84_00620 [Actinomycetota bacterium]